MTRRTPVSETRPSIYRSSSDLSWHAVITIAGNSEGDAVRRHVSAKTRREIVEKVRALEFKRDSAAVPASADASRLSQ